MAATGSPPASEMYSGLRFLLEERELTVADLASRVAGLGETVDPRTLQRLADPDRPLKQVDARVINTICRTLGVDIDALLVFTPSLAADLRRLPEERQRRLHALMDAHAEGELAPAALRELEALVVEADDIDFANTQRVVEHRDRVREVVLSRAHSLAD